MFERERTEPQTDIDFDFFDDSPTVEESPRETVDQPKRRRRLPTRPPTDGTSGLFRLAILIGAAILFAVILVLW
ncbi:MAG: hypothetical protein ACRDM8_07280, partial [Gaiellaceae bacterium]